MNLRDALVQARWLGLDVRKKKNGEWHIRTKDRAITINSRRKCAPRCLTVLLKKARS